MDKVEIIQNDVKEKRISTEEGTRRLIDYIYRNKVWFGLNRLREDSLHDFLLDAYPLLTRMLTSYDSTKGDFTSYLFTNITLSLRGWQRKTAKRNIRDRTLEQIESERIMFGPLGEEEGLFVSDALTEQEQRTEEIKRVITYKKMAEQRVQEGKPKRPSDRLREEAALILMVKSWYMIDSEMLRKISALTDIHCDNLIEILHRTREIMESKSEKLDFARAIRDRAYYYKEFYRMESGLDKNLAFISAVNRKFDYYEKKLEQNNIRLREQNKWLIPSNKVVSQVLGTTTRRIQYVMARINKNMDILPLNWYYNSHEDIFGERKSE